MIGLSAEAEDREGVRTSDPPALRLRQATARACGVSSGRSPTHSGTSLRVRRGRNRTSSTPAAVNDIKRRGVRGAVATTLRQHGAIGRRNVERPHPASSPAWHPRQGVLPGRPSL